MRQSVRNADVSFFFQSFLRPGFWAYTCVCGDVVWAGVGLREAVDHQQVVHSVEAVRFRGTDLEDVAVMEMCFVDIASVIACHDADKHVAVDQDNVLVLHGRVGVDRGQLVQNSGFD